MCDFDATADPPYPEPKCMNGTCEACRPDKLTLNQLLAKYGLQDLKFTDGSNLSFISYDKEMKPIGKVKGKDREIKVINRNRTPMLVAQWWQKFLGDPTAVTTPSYSVYAHHRWRIIFTNDRHAEIDDRRVTLPEGVVMVKTDFMMNHKLYRKFMHSTEYHNMAEYSDTVCFFQS